MTDNLQRTPLISAGIFLGIGLGGFVDGIVFHQILQFHNMLSSRFPPDTLVNAKINMSWDGYFHAAVWLIAVTGIYLLFRAGQRHDVPWSGKTLLGSLIAGWGLFNLVEGTIDHQILGIHHVYEHTTNKLPFDLGFLAFGGVLLLLVGWLLIRAGSNDTIARGEVR
jgi:uncharacterized membrane protein